MARRNTAIHFAIERDGRQDCAALISALPAATMGVPAEKSVRIGAVELVGEER